MTAKNTILAFLVTALSVGLLAGCGGDDSLSDQEYSDELGAAIGPIIESGDLGLGDSSDPDELAQNLAEAKSLLSTAADELEALNPPEDAVEANDQLVQALNDVNASIDPVIEAAESGDQEQAMQEVADFQEAATDFQAEFSDAAMQLEEAGIPEPELPSSGG